jgi:ribosomal protein S27AE
MAEQTNGTLACDYCQNPVTESDEFCPNCGSLFEQNVFCANHPDRDAEGVCIICGAACCSACGGLVNDLFLCERH